MRVNELRSYLKNLWATLVGFADLNNNMKYGIAFAININSKIIKGIHEKPAGEYYEKYNTSDDNLTTTFPNKTVATLAGLGWIGKKPLLITEEYGNAIRISSVLTNRLLITDIPINDSKCGKCSKCVDNCPTSKVK